MKPNFKEIRTRRLKLLDAPATELMTLLEEFPKEEVIASLSFQSEEQYKRFKGNFYGLGTNTNRVTFHTYLIYDPEDGRFLGDCTYHLIWRKHDRAEIGYGLWDEKDRGKGYMREVVETVLKRGFEHHGFQRIEAFTTAVNIPSMKLLQRFGFHREGLTQRHYVEEEGEKATDSIAWGLLPENFRLSGPDNKLEALVSAFERHSLPLPEWTHDAHLSTAMWYIYHDGLENALCKIRPGIITYNAAMGVQNTSDGGYHETITVLWMRLIDHFLSIHPNLPLGESLELFLKGEWAGKNKPLEYYSKDRLMSTQARGRWIEPDLKTLP